MKKTEKEIKISIKKITNGYLVSIQHDIFGCEETFYDNIDVILSRLKESLEILEGIY